MARERSPNRDKAKEMYLSAKGEIKLTEIATHLKVSDSQIRKWKSSDKWDLELNGALPMSNSNVTIEKGAKKQQKKKKKEPIAKEVEKVVENDDLTEKQRLFCIYYIEDFNATKAYKRAYKCNYSTAKVNASRLLTNVNVKKEIQRLTIECLEKEEVNAKLISKKVLDYYIRIAFADINDYVEVEVKEEVLVDGSRSRFNNVIVNSDFDGTIVTSVSQGRDGLKLILADKMKALDFLAKHVGLLSVEVQERLALEREKVELSRPKEDLLTQDSNPFVLPANVIAPPFLSLNYAIDGEEYLEYVLPGGRGSTKSTFISIKIIDLIIHNPSLNAVALRQVANTLRDSVFAQFLWAIDKLGLNDKFKCSYSPLEITYLPTGQKIFFRGADDPVKLKGIKVTKGYIGILWYEELDQFRGPEAVRTIQQSVIRGGDKAFIFKSFNPPKTKNNWANKDLEVPKANRLVVHSNYTQIPKSWLGDAFIAEAEHLKEVNPQAYEHEYLGEANGSGGNIFDNVVIREITNDEIERFDRIYMGVDWGWYPDPWAFNKCYFNAAQRKLYIFDEARGNKMSNKQTYELLANEKGVTPSDRVTCDSAENKSISDYKEYGLYARGAKKGPGSLEYSMKWLQSLNEIVIDNNRCPYTAQEFLDYEYERDKEGNVISGYPDKDNHNIDAVRYATETIWCKKGQ